MKVFFLKKNQRLLSDNFRGPSSVGLFRRRNRNGGGDTPSGRGSEECGLDYVLIPGGRANASRTGWGGRSLSAKPIVFTKYFFKGPSYDRFCGGRLNIDSGTDFNSAVYAPVNSEIFSVQVFF